MTTCRWHSWGLSRETPAVEPGLGLEGEDQVQHHSGLGQTPLVRPRPSSRSMSPPARSLTATLGPPVSELRRQLSRGRGDLHTSPVFSVEQPLMTGTSSASLLHSSGLTPSLTQRRCSLMFVERSGLRATRTEFASGATRRRATESHAFLLRGTRLPESPSSPEAFVKHPSVTAQGPVRADVTPRNTPRTVWRGSVPRWPYTQLPRDPGAASHAATGSFVLREHASAELGVATVGHLSATSRR